MTEIRKLDQKMIETEAFALITIYDDKSCSLEFSKDLSKNSVSRYLSKDFKWIGFFEKKGILSETKKRIYTFCLDTENCPNDKLRLNALCNFFEKRRVDPYYRFGDTENLHTGWVAYARSQCHGMPTAKELGYRLETTKYGNVDALNGIPDGWHETKLTVTQIGKADIPYYKALVGFDESYSHYHPVLRNIIPDDFADAERAYIEGIRQKKIDYLKKVNEIDLTQSVVADCLYSINKEAKRKRDIQRKCVSRAYGYERSKRYPSVHYHLHKAKDEKENLYDLKDKALHKAIALWNLEPVGYHRFPDMERDMYALDGYEFHLNEHESDNYLGEIDEDIDAKRKRSVPPAKAVILLQRFVVENS